MATTKPYVRFRAATGTYLEHKADTVVCKLGTGSVLVSDLLSEFNRTLDLIDMPSPYHRLIRRQHELRRPTNGLVYNVSIKPNDIKNGLPTKLIVNIDGDLTIPISEQVFNVLLAADKASAKHVVLPPYQPRPDSFEDDGMMSTFTAVNCIADGVAKFVVSEGRNSIERVTLVIPPGAVYDIMEHRVLAQKHYAHMVDLYQGA